MTMMENRATNSQRTQDVVRILQEVAPIVARVVPKTQDEAKAVERFLTLVGVSPW